MESIKKVLPKKRGRPATGKDPMFNFRMPDELAARLDEWCERQPEPKPSRSEAIRKFIQLGLQPGRKPR
jgi:Arc/MetJ-type ribon-helix-helix transcriptional regulator